MQDKDMEVLRTLLKRMRSTKQDGYPAYGGNGNWNFISRSLPQTTPEELNALFRLAGLVPDQIIALGECSRCLYSRHGTRSRNHSGSPCDSCYMPRHTNFVDKDEFDF